MIDVVSLAHADQRIAVRLRGLGLSLRVLEHVDPEIGPAFQRIREALVFGGEVDRGDLLLSLLAFRDLLDLVPTRTPGQPVEDNLRSTMDILRRHIRS